MANNQGSAGSQRKRFVKWMQRKTGGKFLEKGKDDLWYEMDEKAARKKASQGKFAQRRICMFEFTS